LQSLVSENTIDNLSLSHDNIVMTNDRKTFASFAICLSLIVVIPLSAQTSSEQLQKWRNEIRHALFVPASLPALNPNTWSSFSPAPGVIADRVTYTTEYGMLVPAIVYRPANARKKAPGIIVVNGHGADKASWYSWYTGILFAKAGAVVLTYDPIGEGERNDQHEDGTGEHDRIITVSGVAQRMGGLMQTDVMQAVSYLRNLPEVDSHRIAVLGFSMGSFVSAITGAIDPRIHAVLLTGGGDLDGSGGYWDSSHAVMCQAGPWRALAFLGDRPAVIYALNARRGPTFVMNGTSDTVVAIPEHGPQFFDDLRRRVIAMNGSPKNVFETWFDPGASHRPAWLLKPAAEWLNSVLHFPNWNPAGIQELPVIRIGDWAAMHDVHLSKSDLRPDRAAGLEAIDAAVPKLTLQQLTVLPTDAWLREKEHLVYSSWVRKAIADAEHGH
jgi:dienelactone hydrolase